MTHEQEVESRKNNERTRKLLNVPKGYIMHHINPEWKTNDVERYIQWNPEDLIVLTISEHRKLHATGKHLNEDTKKKISESSTGKKMSEESKKKNSLAHLGIATTKGKSWYNNGISQTLSFVCPEGFVKGRLSS